MLEPALPDDSSQEFVGNWVSRFELYGALRNFVSGEFFGEIGGGSSREK